MWWWLVEIVDLIVDFVVMVNVFFYYELFGFNVVGIVELI